MPWIKNWDFAGDRIWWIKFLFHVEMRASFFDLCCILEWMERSKCPVSNGRKEAICDLFCDQTTESASHGTYVFRARLSSLPGVVSVVGFCKTRWEVERICFPRMLLLFHFCPVASPARVGEPHGHHHHLVTCPCCSISLFSVPVRTTGRPINVPNGVMAFSEKHPRPLLRLKFLPLLWSTVVWFWVPFQ